MHADHSLNLAIDARAAKSGADQFKNAIEAVRRSIQSLERDSSGVFTALKRVDTSGLSAVTRETNSVTRAAGTAESASTRMAKTLQQTALASASALRQAETDAQRLSIRLQDLGDTAGIQRVHTDLERLRASLLAAQSPLDVRTAKSGYLDTSAELRRSATAAEAQTASLRVLAREEEAASAATRNHQQALERLREAHDPLYAVSQRYAQSLAEIEALETSGMLSSSRAAAARETAAQSMALAAQANDRFGGSANVASHHVQNLSFQMNDIATMAMSGASAFQIAATQTGQISQVLGQLGGKAQIVTALKESFTSLLSPVSLATFAIIMLAGSAAQGATKLAQLASGTADLKSTADALQDLESSLSKVSSTAGNARNFDQLRDTYGSLTREVLDLVKAQDLLARSQAQKDLTESRDALYGENVQGGWMDSLKGYAANSEGQTRKLRDELMLTHDQAAQLESMFRESKGLKSANDMAASWAAMREHILSAAGGYDALTTKQRELVDSLTQAEDSARRVAGMDLANPLDGAASASQRWANSMASVRAEVDSIMSGLARLGTGVLDNAAKSAELSVLQRGGSIRDAETARRRAAFEQEMGARDLEAQSAGGVQGWLMGQQNRFERAQFEESLRLDSAIDSARDAARERDRKGSKSRFEGFGGGDDRIAAKLSKAVNDRIAATQREGEALKLLLASGQYATMEGAQLAADMMAAYGGKLDSASASALKLFERQQQLNEVLSRQAADPVGDYFRTIPTEGESFKNLQAEALKSTRDGLRDVFMSGDIDVSNIVETIRSSLATMMADQVMTMLGDALGYQTGATILSQGIVAGAAQGGAIIAHAMATGSVAGAGAGATAASGGGFWNSIGSMVGLWSEGGYSDRGAMSYSPAPASLFANAPQLKNGTPNTSGIPAILHDNEAVVPLTKGRKIPVDASGLETGGGTTIQNQLGSITVHLQTADRIEDPIQAQRAASQLAEQIRLKVDERLAQATLYGGVLNPRGR